ncbi:porin family protein [Rhodopseudomonas boonkerdii]|nr:outer membrane protein [Rhodopseudomonas boonkerdii]UGV26709.1 porin family protein [Rhodopseudomonas boonkerdii]
MRRLELALLLATFGVAPATAADLSSRILTKAPAVSDPAYSWGGWYAGGQIGGVWAPNNVDSQQTLPSASWPPSSAGFNGGGQIGYNHQIDRWLFGIEADASYTGLRRSPTVMAPLPAGGAFTATSSIGSDWMATLRPRAGYAIDRTLFYLTGGLALTDLNFASSYADTGGQTATGGFDKTRVGWVAGAGIEHAFTKNWTAKIEYLYADFGKQSLTTPVIAGTGSSNGLIAQEVDLKTNTVRGGLNYHFSGSPFGRY